MTAVCLLLFWRCRATYSTGLTLKTGDGWNKKLRAEVSSGSDCPSSPALHLHVFLQACLSGHDAEARVTGWLNCLGLRLTVGL